MPDDPAKPPRFPYIAALLCAGCLGAAGWTWMRYSWAWEVTPRRLWELKRQGGHRGHYPPEGLYVQVRGNLRTLEDGFELLGEPNQPYAEIQVWRPKEVPHPGKTPVLVLKGRFSTMDRLGGGYMNPLVDATASRFHGASVTGLVVGAMGVFVFAVALRHWLGERRRFREETRA
ncbi:MAG: hypothetical protein ACYSU0_21250 [Planctomycetota bacterium]|jgi:hypothetical protein